ncbi:FkbM family methyltransferase [Halovivax gelatinilyticus]|uniref:FkbM family methyltransferase n=1 Tax=Halovivax gelatinilyticus TaxID=2961597 RepID=UPI0020CA76CB|nr:FkbM family methyltransferase [Halovivax gelatinilyticus]
MGLVDVALRKVRDEGIASVLASGISDPLEMVYVSDTFRYISSQYCRFRPIRSRGVVIDASDKILRSEAHKLLMGRYEDEIVDFVHTYIPRHYDVVELGGGIGFVSCNIDRRRSGGEHVVLEPNPEIIPVLKRNRALNDCRFEIVESAYNPAGTDVELAVDEQFIKASTVRGLQDVSTTVQVPGVDLQWIGETFAIERFVLIADIEGAEVELVDSELEFVLESCPYVVIEYHHFADVDADVRSAKETLESSELIALDRRKDDNTEKVIYHNPRFRDHRRDELDELSLERRSPTDQDPQRGERT